MKTLHKIRFNTFIYSFLFLLAVPCFASQTVRECSFLNKKVDGLPLFNIVTANYSISGEMAAILSFTDFGARGDGITDDTKAIQSALDYAAKTGASIYEPAGKVFLVSSIKIKDGIKNIEVKSVIKGKGVATHGIVLLDGPYIFKGRSVRNCRISLNIDMSKGDAYGIRADATQNCIFENNEIYGITDGGKVSKFGINFGKGSNYNKIFNNKITGSEKPKNQGVTQVLLAFFGDSEPYAGYFKNSGRTSEPITPCLGNIISGNSFQFGKVAIDLLACENTVIDNNYCYKQSTRGIYCANSTHGTTIRNNKVIGFGSSALVLGYGAHGNKVINNRFEQIMGYNGRAGEAAINIVGSRNNQIIANTIFSITHYGIYLAIQAVGNTVRENKISGYYLAGIGLENEWRKDPPKDALFSRPNYGAPPTKLQDWAYSNSENNVFESNIIGDAYPNRLACGIYVSQIGNKTKTLRNVFRNNIIANTKNKKHYPYVFFEERSGYLSENVLVGTKISDRNNRKSILSRGEKHFREIHNNDN